MITLTAAQKHAIAVRCGGAVRAFATFAVAFAVQKHWIPGSGAAAGWLGDQLATELAMGLTAGVMFAWSWVNKNKDRNRLLAAIATDPAAAPTLDTFLSDFKAATTDPAAVGTAKMLLVIGLAASLGVMTACASLPRQPNGHLDVVQLLTWTQQGLDVGCSEDWVQADVCRFGTDAIATAKAVALRHPDEIEAAVKHSLVDSEGKIPADSRLRPYLDWLIRRL